MAKHPNTSRSPIGNILLAVVTLLVPGNYVHAAPTPAASLYTSDNLNPHFENIDGRRVFYVEGRPHIVLTAEIPWWNIVWGRQDKNLTAYDYLYPTARALNCNALKVPVKWSLAEPKPGVFDFSYVDHAKRMAERHGLKLVFCWFGHHASSDGTIYYNLAGDVFAPMDVIRDDETYPRAVDADGNAHHNAASYEHDALIRRETAAFRAFMQHLQKTDAESRTVLMVQVENEIAVFGWDRHNRKYWRDHSPVANKLFAEKGFDDPLRYSAWRLSTNWIKPVTDAGHKAYPLPLFLNFVDGKLADWMVGGAPGQDVATYLENCPNVSFIGLNPYLAEGTTVRQFRAKLEPYKIRRNIVAVTETNSDASPVAPRLAYIAIGEFGAPLFAPWSLSSSAPTPFEPYVREDGALAGGAAALRDCYASLSAVISEIAFHAGTGQLKVFMSEIPGDEFSATKEVSGTKVEVTGQNNGQAIVVQTAPHDFIVVGYHCHASIYGDEFVWPALRNVNIERGRSTAAGWIKDGEPYFGIDQSNRKLNLYLESPQAIRVKFGNGRADSK